MALWQLLSRALILRAGGCCEVCGKKSIKALVHHKDGCGLNNSLENLIVLCPSCHMAWHHPKTDLKTLPWAVGGIYGKSSKMPTMRV